MPRQQLFVQPRLGMIGELGRPRFERGRNPMRCMTRSDRSHLNEKGEWTGGASNCRGGIARGYLCGTHADGDEVPKLTLAGLSEHKAVLRNDSRDRIAVSPLGQASGTFGGLSLTSNLIKVRWPNAGGKISGGCEAYLGIGHLHRGEGQRNKHLYKRRARGMPPWGAPSESGLKRKQPFVFGFRYTHFWYTLQPKPPFGVLAASHEFCIASPQDPQDCESVQFVSGLEKHPNGSVLMAYGVNDCEARVATMSLSKIWKMLKPLDGRAKRRGVCASVDS